ncbi:SDR family NAD(P)-dependent oxidoreductase [Mangrovihabitans endophyticus]|uniref:Putative short-chain dehydrogenase/reductase n=1 Tax=Mangrovihabitans endophyticus TaxID=1751298 RepID=A0A8J3BW68_9ACTN|nr:SDR family NAD(P)-dependent oxidoreductase [Mangrovihabitans endophyticus]GGK74696.1 putative short-chain dehydrogenase/reductase [Mangrovihabitans endophyticus]
MTPLSGRVAVVTGAGRGIGASVARLLAAQGARVVVNDLGGALDGSGSDETPAAQVVKDIVATGGEAVANGADVGDAEAGEGLIRTAIDTFGTLDVLVNAAGILRDRMIFNMSEQEWDDVIRVHLKGHFNTIKPAAAFWHEQRNENGHYRLINFTSSSGLFGAPGQPNYAAAKMGIVGLTYSCANGLARYGVTANAISPGAATRMTASVPDDRRRAGVRTDLERSPDNVAPIVAYLAGEQSDWLTGRVIGASGYDVTLYQNPEPMRVLSAAQRWSVDALAAQVERVFKPVVTRPAR